MWRGMMVPNVCANLSSGEAPDFRFERTLCRLKKNRNLFIIMSNSQNAYLELLLKNDCSESSRHRHTLCGWMDVASALTLPVPYGCAHGNTLASRWGSLTSRARADYRVRGATRTFCLNKNGLHERVFPEALCSRGDPLTHSVVQGVLVNVHRTALAVPGESVAHRLHVEPHRFVLRYNIFEDCKLVESNGMAFIIHDD